MIPRMIIIHKKTGEREREREEEREEKAHINYINKESESQ